MRRWNFKSRVHDSAEGEPHLALHTVSHLFLAEKWSWNHLGWFLDQLFGDIPCKKPQAMTVKQGVITGISQTLVGSSGLDMVGIIYPSIIYLIIYIYIYIWYHHLWLLFCMYQVSVFYAPTLVFYLSHITCCLGSDFPQNYGLLYTNIFVAYTNHLFCCNLAHTGTFTVSTSHFHRSSFWWIIFCHLFANTPNSMFVGWILIPFLVESSLCNLLNPKICWPAKPFFFHG